MISEPFSISFFFFEQLRLYRCKDRSTDHLNLLKLRYIKEWWEDESQPQNDRNQNANLSPSVHENLPFINGCTKLLDFVACVVFSQISSSIIIIMIHVCVLHTIGHSHWFGFRVRVANSFYRSKSEHGPERFFNIEFWAVNNQWEEN